MSNMAIDLNVFCAIMKHRIEGDSINALIITVHVNRIYHRDTHIM